MPDDSQDDSQKTEDPTQRRIEESLKKGQVAFSREVTSFLMLFAFAMVIVWLAPGMMRSTVAHFAEYLGAAEDIAIDNLSIGLIGKNVAMDFARVMFLPVLLLFAVIFLSPSLQNSWVMSWNSVQPKLEKISILKGFKRLFSLKSIVEFLKGIIKLVLIGVGVYLAVAPSIDELELAFALPVIHSFGMLSILATRLMIAVCVVMGVIAFLDFLYQKFEHTKSLRMSHQDIKDEFKQTEGNPEVKAKLRALRAERSQNRMMSNVPKATAVVTNPTHFAVALQYDPATQEAPLVVAKGMDFIALKIREIAKENNVPIIENPPLARALFSSAEVDQEIPFEHFKAVAEVIKYVYKLQGKKL